VARFSFLSFLLFIVISSCNVKLSNGLRKNDLKRDVEITTDKGIMVVRLSDSTPLHRDNFLKLAKQGYFDSMLFHRVIKNFMIQSGDPNSKHAKAGEALGNGDPGYTIPAEFRASLFHKKGAIAAARTGDDVNPKKASSGSQFYIVEGGKYPEQKLDTIEVYSKKKLSPEQRQAYKTIGGTPWLDGGYTVFGEVVIGLDVIDSIAVARTDSIDRPVTDIHILKMKLIKRGKK
jgi:cyclophilin family peptidyl-prolyl cis-trans isomerase